VVTVAGVELGTVRDMIETGANDVMLVRGERERLIPFVMGHYVRSVDLDAKRIEVDWDPDF
jgi:16S rRNA processing protein RimM